MQHTRRSCSILRPRSSRTPERGRLNSPAEAWCSPEVAACSTPRLGACPVGGRPWACRRSGLRDCLPGACRSGPGHRGGDRQCRTFNYETSGGYRLAVHGRPNAGPITLQFDRSGVLAERGPAGGGSQDDRAALLGLPLTDRKFDFAWAGGWAWGAGGSGGGGPMVVMLMLPITGSGLVLSASQGPFARGQG
jgi:hypothetical protein